MWKIDANGNIVMKDGNPVFLNSAGQEQTVAHDTIARLNAEAKTHRERAEAAEAALKPFEGLDPSKARESIELVSKIDQKKLIESGKVEEVRAEVKKQYDTQLAEREKALNDTTARLNSLLIDSVFNSSKFVHERVAIPHDIFKASFSKNFKIENGEVIPYDKNGVRLYSKERAGEYATPEEALQLYIDARPDKDSLLKAATSSGSGNQGGGGGQGAGNIMKRADFEKLTPAKQSETAAKVNAGEMKLTD